MLNFRNKFNCTRTIKWHKRRPRAKLLLAWWTRGGIRTPFARGRSNSFCLIYITLTALRTNDRNKLLNYNNITHNNIIINYILCIYQIYVPWPASEWRWRIAGQERLPSGFWTLWHRRAWRPPWGMRWCTRTVSVERARVIRWCSSVVAHCHNCRNTARNVRPEWRGMASNWRITEAPPQQIRRNQEATPTRKSFRLNFI